MHILQYLLILQVKLWWVRNQLIISSSTCPVLVFDFWSALGKNLSALRTVLFNFPLFMVPLPCVRFLHLPLWENSLGFESIPSLIISEVCVKGRDHKHLCACAFRKAQLCAGNLGLSQIFHLSWKKKKKMISEREQQMEVLM